MGKCHVKTSKMENHEKKYIISASRRTDIPAFYLDWFMEGIQAGSFEVINPYNRVKRIIDISPEKVHSIVFWSKNYGPFLGSGAHDKLIKLGYNLFFHFSINSENSVLEPGVPSLKIRLDQLEELSGINSPENIVWRFDPVCYYMVKDGVPGGGSVKNNLSDFSKIAEKASRCGVTKAITSFVDPYKKINTRINYLQKQGSDIVKIVDIDSGKKVRILKRMAKLLKSKGISLDLCCEKELFSHPGMPGQNSIGQSACISGRQLSDLFKGNPVTQRDYGQRAKQGCLCTKSIDIGSYEQHPCFHNCIFCYANPAIDQKIKKREVAT